MRAVVLPRYGQPEDLEVRDVPRPAVGPDDVLVDVRAASVNDWDWGLVRGVPAYIKLFTGLYRPKIAVPGVDVAGVVAEVGDRVDDWTVGDRVFGDLSACGLGGFAEFAVAPRDALVAIPPTLGFREAAALPHAACLALQASRLAGLRAGERLLVNGAGGGVGTLAVQLAHHLGVTDVVGVDHGDKHAAMRAAGFATSIDYRREDFTLGPSRYDVVLDARTDRRPSAYARVLAPGGRYVTVGGSTGGLLGVFLLGRFARGGRRLKVLALEPNRGLDEIAALCDAGVLAPLFDDTTFTLDDVPAAIRRFGESSHVGKIVVTVGDG